VIEYVNEVAEFIRTEIRKAIVGQDALIEQILVAMFAEGHILIEGVPGTGKTLAVKSLARILNAGFNRIQFTPDLMPSDVTGTNVYNISTGAFTLRPGPIFTDILLADEINRTPPKTQAALLEAMEERQATIDGERHDLSPMFTVLATQNPIEYEGTYPLPEAQLDRFLLKVVVDYPTEAEETEVVRMWHTGFNARRLESLSIRAFDDPAAIPTCRARVRQVRIEESIGRYITGIVRRIRCTTSRGARARALPSRC
jgi:MoxR-like ATPase